MMKGYQPEVISSNVREMMKSGRPQKSAIAASLASARKFKKMAKGGMVDMDKEDPENYMRSLNEIRDDGEYYPNEVANPNEQDEAQGFAAALRRQANNSLSPENYASGGYVKGDSNEDYEKSYQKSEEEDEEGEKGYAQGGLVQAGPEEDQRLNGAQPELGWIDDGTSEPMSAEPMKPQGQMRMGGEPSGPGLSAEAKAAILRRKMGRRYGAFDPKS